MMIIERKDEKGVEKEHLIEVMSSALNAFQKRDVFALKELSNQTVHSASVFQNIDNISVAVIIYSLSKIVERPKYMQYKSWPNFQAIVINKFQSAINALKNSNISLFRNYLSEINASISTLSGHLKVYIEDVFRKAAINKASRIYEHGISMQQTADILGISSFELAEYAGRTGIADVELSVTSEVKKRIKTAMELFEA